MNTQEVKQFLEENPDESAYGLLMDADPNIERRFKRATKTLVEILKDVKEHFPEAEYYTASGGLNILLGQAHSGNECTPNQELAALGADSRLAIGDGDW